MNLARIIATVVLWLLVLSTTSLAYMASVRAASLDARLLWALPPCLAAVAAGHLTSLWWARRRGPPWTVALGADGHGLALLVTTIAIAGMSHVAPQMSIRVLSEQIPPLFAFFYPSLCFVTPWLLRRTRATVDGPDQLLLAAVALTTLSGAVLMLEAPVALGLGLAALLAQLGAGGRRPRMTPLALAVVAMLGLVALATLTGHDRLSSQPSLTWVGAAGALAAAAAVRPRSPAAWRRLLAAPVIVAVLVAGFDVLLTADLARRLTLAGALESRLVLFRQHPNFLAPFYVFHAVLALGLLAGARRRWPLLSAFALLVAGTWHTDSNTGMAALLLGLALIPVLLLLRRWTLGGRSLARLGLLVAAPLLVLLVLGIGAALTRPALRAQVSARIDRFEKSWDYRIDAWRNSLLVIGAHPLLGLGPGTFMAMERFRPGSRFANEPEPPHPHNMFLYVTQAAGLGALIVLLAWLALVLRRLWRAACHLGHAGDPDRGPPPFTALALIAATGALLFANLFDLSMSLDTVVPAPLFLVTGLLLAANARPRSPSVPATRACTALLLLATFVLWALQPIRAQAAIEQAQLYALLAGRGPGREALMASARDAMTRAIALDPTRPRAHELLARWLEKRPDGFLGARGVLMAYTRLSPRSAHGHSLLGQLYLRAGMWQEAADELAVATSVFQGGEDIHRDRADRIWCLARLGRADEVRRQLAEALRLDRGVIDRLPWTEGADGRLYLPMGGADEHRVALSEAIEQVYAGHLEAHAEGREVGRRAWMDTYHAFRRAGLDDRARDVLDWCESNAPEVEPQSIEGERAELAAAAGDHVAAVEHFRRAYELSGGNPFYQVREKEMRLKIMGVSDGGDTDPASTDPLPDIRDAGDVMAFGQVYVQAYDSRARRFEQAGRLADAGRETAAKVLFQDDVLERARLLVRAGDLLVAGGAHEEAEQAYVESLAHMAAKPFPYSALRIDHTRAWPDRAALGLCSSWRGQGLDTTAMQRRAWALPGAFSPRQGPSLARLGSFAGMGRADALLRESDLLLLADPQHPLAEWWRLFALEALGRHAELPMAMRSIIETFNRQGSAEHLWNLLVERMQAEPERQGDPAEWYAVAMADLMRGRYGEAGGLFEQAADRLGDEPRKRAEYLGWAARAHQISGAPDAPRRVRELLTRAVELDPHDRLLALRLGTLP